MPLRMLPIIGPPILLRTVFPILGDSTDRILRAPILDIPILDGLREAITCSERGQHVCEHATFRVSDWSARPSQAPPPSRRYKSTRSSLLRQLLAFRCRAHNGPTWLDRRIEPRGFTLSKSGPHSRCRIIVRASLRAQFHLQPAPLNIQWRSSTRPTLYSQMGPPLKQQIPHSGLMVLRAHRPQTQPPQLPK